MLRESIPLPKKRQHSAVSATKFFGLADAIAKIHEPTPTQLAALERSYESVGQYVIDSPEFADLALRAHAQGSRAIGTIIRPVWANAFDVDLVIRLHQSTFHKYAGQNGPARLINGVCHKFCV